MMFEILETQKIVDGNAELVLVPAKSAELLADLLATQASQTAPAEQTGQQ